MKNNNFELRFITAQCINLMRSSPAKWIDDLRAICKLPKNSKRITIALTLIEHCGFKNVKHAYSAFEITTQYKNQEVEFWYGFIEFLKKSADFTE